MKLKSKILIIAGSDSSGGAGIQADIKTVTALGGYAMTAITAVTVQNTRGVDSVIPIKPKDIRNQILFTCKDIRPNAIKIGMLHSSQVIETVSNALKKIKSSKIVLDPHYFCLFNQQMMMGSPCATPLSLIATLNHNFSIHLCNFLYLSRSLRFDILLPSDHFVPHFYFYNWSMIYHPFLQPLHYPSPPSRPFITLAGLF